MASRAVSEVARLLAVALLLPLRFLSLALRPPFSHPSAAAPRRARSAAALLAVAALVSAICAVPDAETRTGVATSPDADAEALRSEIEALRLKVAQLESLLEENTNTLNSKASILEEDNNEAMERDMQILIDGPEIEKSTKDSKSKSYSASSIKSMEDEVQQLQQEVSKINKNSNTIESLARDTERRVEALSSEVKKIEDIIAEQWIQIRQFEQAFVLTKMMTSKVHERSRPSYKWLGKETILKYAGDIDLKDMFLRGASYARSCFSHTYKQPGSFLQEINRYYHEAYRFRKAIHHQYIPDTDRPNVFFLGGSVSRSSISIPYNQFKIFISSTQKFHHKVQVFLHDALESNRYSRSLANEPVTFILAYLLVVSPMWIAWFLYSMRFGSRK